MGISRIAVIGGEGMLGKDVVSSFQLRGIEAIAADKTSTEHPVDITDMHSVESILAGCDAAVLTAAYTDVDGCERIPELAYHVNAFGAGAVASVCRRYSIPMVYISTDFVFDGRTDSPYREHQPANPLGAYGASKWAGEQWVREVCPEHYICRTAWLFGANGKNFPKTMLNAHRAGRELKVVADQQGCPTYTRDLAEWVCHLLLNEAPYGTYHTVNSGSTSWHGLAEEVFRIAGLDVAVKPIDHTEFPTPTERPAYSVLNTDRLRQTGATEPRPWQQALKDFMKEIGECAD